MNRASYVLSFLFAACAPAYAQSGFTGTWQAESTPPGTTWTAVLRVDGTRLTGVVSSCSSNSAEIKIYEGRIDASTIMFKCDSLNGVRTMTFTGRVNGGEIAFSWVKLVRNGGTPSARDDGLFGPSAPPQFTAKRVKDGALAKRFDEVPGLELAAAVNLAQKDVKVEGRLFLPPKVSRVRAVIVVIHWGDGTLVYDDPEWRRLSETLESGLLRTDFSTIAAPADNRPRNAGLGGADALLKLLERLADESGHPEISDAPLLFWGHSAGGIIGPTFAAIHPQRTIAFVGYHSGNAGAGFPADPKVLSQIPSLLLAGVVRQRLSPDGGALRVVSDASAWLGNNQTGEIASYATFQGSKAEASWLPDEASALAWRGALGVGK
jgi:hypothetical protein